MSCRVLDAPQAALQELWPLAERQARAHDRPVILSCAEHCEPVDPIALFAHAASHLPRVLWLVPEREEALVGLAGQRLPLQSVTSPSLPLPARLAAAWRALAQDALAEGPLPPLAVAGLAFDPADERPDPWWQPFGRGQLLLPSLLYRQQGALACRSVQAAVFPGEREPRALLTWPTSSLPTPSAAPRSVVQHELVRPDDWRRMIQHALAAIAAGDLRKVVLARARELVAAEPFPLEQALRELAARYPSCTVFAIGIGETVFLGASPERLARVAHGTVATVALAGSRPRARSPEQDHRAAEELRRSDKDRHEHALVVEAIRAALAPLCTSLSIPEEPAVVSMANVHHLGTPISGILHDGASVLDVVARLHPTPAVGGTPREAALAFIRQHEPVPRGWYAGALGWIEASGDGEIVVGLRSGLVRSQQARLYAGCGIVADSDPVAEWAEAEAKFRPMLEALAGG